MFRILLLEVLGGFLELKLKVRNVQLSLAGELCLWNVFTVGDFMVETKLRSLLALEFPEICRHRLTMLVCSVKSTEDSRNR